MAAGLKLGAVVLIGAGSQGLLDIMSNELKDIYLVYKD